MESENGGLTDFAEIRNCFQQKYEKLEGCFSAHIRPFSIIPAGNSRRSLKTFQTYNIQACVVDREFIGISVYI